MTPKPFPAHLRGPGCAGAWSAGPAPRKNEVAQGPQRRGLHEGVGVDVRAIRSGPHAGSFLSARRVGRYPDLRVEILERVEQPSTTSDPSCSSRRGRGRARTAGRRRRDPEQEGDRVRARPPRPSSIIATRRRRRSGSSQRSARSSRSILEGVEQGHAGASPQQVGDVDRHGAVGQSTSQGMQYQHSSYFM